MLNFGIEFTDLYTIDGLQKIDNCYQDYLRATMPDLHTSLINVRLQHNPSDQHSQLIIDLAIQLEIFMTKLFDIDQAIDILQSRHHAYHDMAEFKYRIIKKRILPKFLNTDWRSFNQSLYTTELAMSDLELIQAWYNAEQSDKVQANRLENYMAWRCYNPDVVHNASTSDLFTRPQILDFNHLFNYTQDQQTIAVPDNDLRPRRGFDLTDSGRDNFYPYDQAYYCIKCHKTQRDSCAHGLYDQLNQMTINPLGNILNGCPLKQKISEMNVVKQQGYCLAALAIITIDNPMVAATGYRICNDCEKACIFQKQTPVDVPSIETQILTAVLALPWGFEIYSLLTRWNPLNFLQPLPIQSTGYTVLVAGMGPAGFTLAHYLLRLGHHVLGIDALKIEPLPYAWWGRTADGDINFEPIADITTVTESLSTRTAYGFGGVAEYGITSRWNKNFLTIIRLILMRNPYFQLSGQTRFGGTITLSSAHTMGFDHVALCLGSGKPYMPQMSNILASGVRAASDFLMNLQANGAARDNALTALQIRLPIVVIGGGLTAVDAATEALAYYQDQIERFLIRYQQLCKIMGAPAVEQDWSPQEQAVAREFITHAQLLRQIRSNQLSGTYHHKIIATLQAWGGVQIVYRKALQHAPAYTTNAHEIQQALAQGIRFVEHTVLQNIVIDNYGAVKAIEIEQAGIIKQMPVRTLLLATGIGPNTYYNREHPDEMDWTHVNLPEINSPQPFIKNSVAAGYTSIFGDLDPQFSGSVVKAMASAKQGYLSIDAVLKRKAPLVNCSADLLHTVMYQLQARVTDNTAVINNLTKLVISAPLAARHYKIGQFFKLQNFEKNDQPTASPVPIMKGVALTPIHIDQQQGLLTFIVTTSGSSTAFIQTLQPGDQVALMGPTGAPYPIQRNQQVLIITDDLYGLMLLPIIQALQQNHGHIHIYGMQQIEGGLFKSMLHNDRHVIFHHEQSTVDPILSQLNQIIVSGTSSQLQALQSIINTQYIDKIQKDCQILASINAPMQCMMKEICAQCLQQQIDPVTGAVSYFYACAQQWQPLTTIDIDVLQGRHIQNSLIAKLNYTWFQRIPNPL